MDCSGKTRLPANTEPRHEHGGGNMLDRMDKLVELIDKALAIVVKPEEGFFDSLTDQPYLDSSDTIFLGVDQAQSPRGCKEG